MNKCKCGSTLEHFPSTSITICPDAACDHVVVGEIKDNGKKESTHKKTEAQAKRDKKAYDNRRYSAKYDT